MSLILPGPYKGLRIGLFGGTFNPAHSGHRHLADLALQRLQLDWIWWIPAAGNPLKSKGNSFDSRFASAVRMADHPRMRVTDIEVQLGTRYSYDTLRALLPRVKGGEFVWLMGADNLRNFHKWGHWDDLAQLVPIAVIARPGDARLARLSKFAHRFSDFRLPSHAAAALTKHELPAWSYLPTQLHTASSTHIRRQTRARNPFRPKPQH
ncbi:MAG: nicotinic acid mononucleotide adenylyltransferase [Ponticaulis sp.]|nr:nicotinic acid mononucleotide adenylyltransferase [Ponticaulis sp.]|tara:strand:+ start:18625 stop:19248 length:624 start_codon:yes stop_codon:yes gene_type:complete